MVVLKETTNMFWGITLDGGKRYSQTVEQPFHISMAALEPGKGDGDKKGGTVSVMILHEKAEFLLCSLNPHSVLQQPLDLNFTEGEEVIFYLTGHGSVHLTGYLHEDMAGDETMMEEMSEEDATDESDDDEEEDDDDEAEVPTLAALKDMEEESEEEEEDDWTPGKGKRKKTEKPKSNKKSKVEVIESKDDEDDDEEDDSDDDEDMDNFLGEGESEESDEEDDLELPAVESDDGESEDSTGSYEKPAKQEKQKSKKAEKGQQGKVSGKQANKEAVTPSGKGDKVDNSQLSKSQKKRLKKKLKKEQAGEVENKTNTPADSKKTPTANTTKPSKTPVKRVVAGGTTVEELKEGHGPEAKSGKTVGVYYSGKLLQNGKQFDACTGGKPFKFKLGKGEVIKGWDHGLAGMKVGSKRRITVPPSQGYGGQRSGPIPANSTLVFEVELKSVS